MDLAERDHHTAPRRQKKARVGEASRTTRPRSGRHTHPAGLCDLSFGEEPGGVRPDRLAGVRPQEQEQRHTVEQIVDAVVAGLPTLDAAGGRAPVLRRAFACCRAGYRRAQDHPRGHPDANLSRNAAGGKVAGSANNPVFFSSGGGGRLADLQLFHPEQSSTALVVEQIDDIPVPSGGLQGFRPKFSCIILIFSLFSWCA